MAINQEIRNFPLKQVTVGKSIFMKWVHYLCVKSYCACEWLATVCDHSDILTGSNFTHAAWKLNGIALVASQSKSPSILPGLETQWNNAHTHQITTVNSLKAFRNHRFHTLGPIKI